MFYDIFKRLCMENGTAPTAVCEELGLSNAAASYWKKSGNPPKRETLEKIAERFGVSVDYLLGRDVQKISIHIPRESKTATIQRANPSRIVIGAPIKERNANLSLSKYKLVQIKPKPKTDWIKLLSSLTDDNLKRLADYADLLLLQQSQADQAPK